MTKLTIEEMHTLAKSRNGECLSTTYINNRTKLLWECSQGHKWWAPPKNVKHCKSWCKICAYQITQKHRKKNIKDMQKLVEKHKGNCLSTKYKDPFTKLKWQCKNQHVFFMKSNDVQQGHWCKQCAWDRFSKKNKLGIKLMQEIAKEKNGLCLSKEYHNHYTKLIWKCEKGHVWEATPNSVRKSWCPECSDSKNEKLCRKIMQSIFGHSFPTKRPSWLRNEVTNYRLELDGFNKDLKLAFEYNGKQHYISDTKFHKTKDEFHAQQKRDILKNKICKKHNITLITIPYWIQPNNMKNFILQEIKKGAGSLV